MNVDTAEIRQLEEIEKMDPKKRKDWEELPEGLTPLELAKLQQPMNRKQRRAMLAKIRRQKK